MAEEVMLSKRLISVVLPSAGAFFLLLVVGIPVYYELVKRDQWEAAARTDISRQATKKAEEVFEAKEKEYIDQLLNLKEEGREKTEEYEERLRSYQRRVSSLQAEIERVKEEGRANEELLARLSGFALFERVLARLDESWTKHGLTVADR